MDACLKHSDQECLSEKLNHDANKIMGQKIQAVKGMNDLLPVEQRDFKLTSAFWQAFEETVARWAKRYAYQQIRTPILEQTKLFVRSIGEETDVVGKEMYTFPIPTIR